MAILCCVAKKAASAAQHPNFWAALEAFVTKEAQSSITLGTRSWAVAQWSEATVPSVGLCLNASKAETRLDTATLL